MKSDGMTGRDDRKRDANADAPFKPIRAMETPAPRAVNLPVAGPNIPRGQQQHYTSPTLSSFLLHSNRLIPHHPQRCRASIALLRRLYCQLHHVGLAIQAGERAR